jgi:glutathione S-transferase
MIELYTWTTPNGQKVSIMLEEVGLPYRAHPIDILNNAQFDPISPSGRGSRALPGRESNLPIIPM